jgi:hypothetical protein
MDRRKGESESPAVKAKPVNKKGDIFTELSKKLPNANRMNVFCKK